ncbi:ABC transporter G family member 20-like [Bradysia coprophila]|uniref:ABC transporter G family member 20-like n=1 Tax=Bradysia coprophila TaxID=38358 RepID=UPI00187DCC8A|nr:ABC transporter G family member 20-like [Bradysia coprophila]XP_037048977.1 ABC transporter G family member 20-like [Bradysia coprophila]
MPQEVALNGEFTIREVCHYFGRIYGMEKNFIDDRIEKLLKLLDLKNSNQYINTLSGGQQRRASFIVALLHEPSILILDEPTVGVDPVLRASIWQHLRDIVDTYGTTAIITTHYIEEMRQANTIGIMRNGVMMTEESPARLLEINNANMLEDVVLKYCLKDEVPQIECGPETAETFNPAMYKQDENTKSSQTRSIHRIGALTIKNLIVLMRNIGFLLFTFGSPALIVSIFCFAIGSSPKDLGMGVINNELVDCKNFTEITSCEPIQLSCAFLNKLASDRKIKLITVENVDHALQKVDRRKIWGYIKIPPNFSQNIFDRTLGRSTSNTTIFGSQIDVRLDMASISIGLSIKKFIFDAYQSFTINLLSKCGVKATGLDTPVFFEDPIYGSEDSEFTYFVAPGVTTGFLFFMSALTCGLAYIIEKKDGMLHRSLIAGVTTMEIMVSHFIPQFAVVIGQAVLAFVIMFVVFEIPQTGSPVLAFFLVLLSSVCGMAMGFMASTLFDEEKSAMLMAIALIFPNFLLAGLIWPIESLPGTMQKISLFLPGTLACESIRAILLRGWGFSYFTVWVGFVSTSGWISVYVIATYIIYNIRK